MLLTYKVGHTHEVGIVLTRQYWVKKQLYQYMACETFYEIQLNWRAGRTLSDYNESFLSNR